MVDEIIMPRERAVDRVVHYPQYTEREVVESVDIDVPRERMVDVPVYIDKEVEVEMERERVVPVPEEEVVERVVEIFKTVEKPIFTPRVVEKRVEKIVERRVEVPIEKYVEVPKIVHVPREIQVNSKRTQTRVVDKLSHRNLRKSIKRSQVSASQKSAFTQLGETLNDVRVQNIKLNLEIKTLRDQIVEYQRISRNPTGLINENNDLRNKISDLRQRLSRVNESNEQIIRNPLVVESQQIELHSADEISQLEKQIREIESKNLDLKRALTDTGVKVLDVTRGPILTLHDPSSTLPSIQPSPANHFYTSGSIKGSVTTYDTTPRYYTQPGSLRPYGFSIFDEPARFHSITNPYIPRVLDHSQFASTLYQSAAGPRVLNSGVNNHVFSGIK